MKIHKTTDYAQFNFAQTNRPINLDHHKFKLLLASMKKYGWLPSFPMTVKSAFGGMQIIDGQHRFKAAKELGIPVLFVVIESGVGLDIATINAAHRQWGLDDYVRSFESQGNRDYHHLRSWAEANEVSILSAASLLNGEIASGGNVRDAVIKGAFKVKDCLYADRVARIIAAVPSAEKWTRSSSFITAVSRLCRVPEFDGGRLMTKMQTSPALLVKQPDIPGYTKMLDAIYNRSARDRVPLAFRVAEVMRERSAA